MDRKGCLTLAAAASVLLTGCGEATQGSTAAPTVDRQLDLGVVGISADIGGDEALSSGFVVDGARGLIVTTAHGVWGARSIKLATAFGVLHGRIVARAPCDDIALLETHPRIPGLATLPSAPPGTPAADQLLRSVGRRWLEGTSTTAGIASIPVRATAGGGLDSSLVPEVSGGPVVDPAGRLLGMAQAGEGPAHSIPWTAIRARLDQLKPGPRRIFVGWADQYRCVGRQHANARAAHPGFRAADARLVVPITPTRLPGAERLDP